MAEIGFQVSTKTADGTIFVIADATYSGFAQKLTEALDTMGAESLLDHMLLAFTGRSMAVSHIAASLGGEIIQSNKWETAPPPLAVVRLSGGPLCKHGEEAKMVPAGVAKASGKAYKAFYACSRPQGQQCDFRANAS